MQIGSKLGIFFLFFSLLFLTGCKKEEVVKKEIISFSEKEKYFTVFSSKVSSKEEIALTGLQLIPHALEERMSKNEDFYILDLVFDARVHTRELLFSLLRNLYVNEGWVFLEEVVDLEYSTALCKKADGEIYIFIETRQEYIKAEKKCKEYIFLHQSFLKMRGG